MIVGFGFLPGIFIIFYAWVNVGGEKYNWEVVIIAPWVQ